MRLQNTLEIKMMLRFFFSLVSLCFFFLFQLTLDGAESKLLRCAHSCEEASGGGGGLLLWHRPSPEKRPSSQVSTHWPRCSGSPPEQEEHWDTEGPEQEAHELWHAGGETEMRKRSAAQKTSFSFFSPQCETVRVASCCKC